ncbi:chaplin [Streptomyces sp. NPDC093094]|uniref:chaplin n=1 Tax=Streptomyces sp. NPDC093094 TaxID=3366026 RepID=UPI0038041797
MRQVTRKGLMTVAAATGVIAAAGGTAQASSGASGSASNSPGVLSGNSVQAPVHAPVNVCGNTVDVVGVLNPAMGNSCANRSGSPGGAGHQGGGHNGHGNSGGHGGHGGHSGYGDSGGHGGSGAHGSTTGSPGVGSGNHVQAPVDAPVNVCGNTVDVVGVLNPAMGNDCGSGYQAAPPEDDGYGTPPGTPVDRNVPPLPQPPDDRPPVPGDRTPDHDRPATPTVPHPRSGTQLASTGSELPLGAAGALGVGAVLGGALLYRRARASA